MCLKIVKKRSGTLYVLLESIKIVVISFNKMCSLLKCFDSYLACGMYLLRSKVEVLPNRVFG